MSTSRDDWPEELRGGKKPKRQRVHKYDAKRTVVDGITFHSKKEAEHYQTLRSLEMLGAITNLRRQVPFKWVNHHFANGVMIQGKNERYYVDFMYEHNGKTVYVDVKGFRTPEYKRKKLIVEALFNVKIEEV